MKKLVVAMVLVVSSFFSNAQTFKKGETVEVDVHLSADGNMKWLLARVIDIDLELKTYVVKASNRKTYNIPFGKEESWIRKPAEKLSSMKMITTDSLHNCYASVDMVRHLLTKELLQEYSHYDSVSVTFNLIDPTESYRNTDDDFGLEGSMVYPFNVDLMVRLVTITSDGTQKILNSNVKRKYIVFQNRRGICDVAIAEKQEKLMSRM